jgi:diaminohydroxyphosphoribosylaminopyrimidine deaminase / 5-amino-6-(5-phosphoribosylamino)uracil reductase
MMDGKGTELGLDRARAFLNGDPSAERLLELYAPLLGEDLTKRLVIGHVGQSLDGQIATRTGASRYITGGENLTHVHRLRALVDAVVVGASTVEFDDPQLTTRLVPGKNPVRVVIDPNLRLAFDRRVFTDGAVQTLVVCADDAAVAGRKHPAELVRVPRNGQYLPPGAIADALGRRGLNRLFVEGGGVTVSRFIEAGALDRLHVTIGPLLVGSGRPGIVLPGIDRVDQALRPVTRRFELGADVLFDCRLTSEA